MLDLPKLDPHLLQLAARATDRARDHKFECSIDAPTEEIPARWHVIVTQPNRENTAAGHLMRRSFGVYLPEFDEVAVIRGRKRIRHQPLFPTYIFAFVWRIERQWHRISACTGVVRLLLSGDKPAVVPDRLIDAIQATELSQVAVTQPEPRSKRRIKRWQRELMRDEDMLRASSKSYFDGIDKIDGPARNSVLHRALNLPLR